jgi:hypothetical protein
MKNDGDGTVSARLDLLQAHQAGLREQIATLRQHEKALESKIATYHAALAAESGHRNDNDEGSAHE